MKRLLPLFLTLLCFMATVCACRQEPAETDGVKVVTAAFPYYDLVKQIAGDCATVTLLLKPGEEPHSYEPTPKDILALRSCDLFLYTGGESDAWLKALLDGTEESSIHVLPLIESVNPLETEHNHDRDSGKGGHTVVYDEHIWTSPANMVRLTEVVAKALISVDPAGRDVYEANAAAYRTELETLDRELRALVGNAARRLLVFGDRFPFLYLTEEYGLDHAAAFSGCSEESEVSPATVAELVRTVRANNIPVVFCTELSSGRIADSICAETGAVKRSLHSCANVTKDEAAAGATYLSLMQQNLTVLREALGENNA